jgi:hypothetical protein
MKNRQWKKDFADSFEPSLNKEEPEQTLVHYSPQAGLKEIDPKFKGTGVDSRTKNRNTWHPHSFYYKEGTEPESLVADQSQSKYHVKINPKDHPIYDIGTDPKGLVRESIEENQGAHNMDDVHSKVKFAGYKGFHNSTHPSLSHVVAMYHPLPVHHEEKLGKSESLEKGAVKNAITAGLLGTALATSTPALSPVKDPEAFSKEKIIHAIKQVESSGGKNTHHKPTSQGTAYGSAGIMPDTIKETIKLNPELKNKHKKALGLNGPDLHHYMQDNPELEQAVIDKHFDRLQHHFGQNPLAISAAWNQGITHTKKMVNNKEDLSNHPYVQKFKRAYREVK